MHGSDGGSELLDFRSIVAIFFSICALPAVSITLAAPMLASYWMYSWISSPKSAIWLAGS
jgi:hypothetical protein